MAAVEIDELRRVLYARAPGESVTYTKTELPELPNELSATVLGTPNWIAHPGAIAQYRASLAIHAYEMEDVWDFHRDRYDPYENPLGHFFFDAPELPIAVLLSAVTGLITYCVMDRREKEKPKDERSWWIPSLVALGVAAIVGILVYIAAAFVRVAVGTS